MQVADVTTAAQLFHLLRRQVLRSTRKPLILFTPKRYLRGREAYSPASEFASGHFREVLDDPGVADPRRRAAGGPGHRARSPSTPWQPGPRTARTDVAVVRVEQLHPWPADQIAAPWPATPGPRGGLAAGGTGEHGRLELRPGPAPRPARRRLPLGAREPGGLRVRRRPAATPCTSSSRPTCWPAPSDRASGASSREALPNPPAWPLPALSRRPHTRTARLCPRHPAGRGAPGPASPPPGSVAAPGSPPWRRGSVVSLGSPPRCWGPGAAPGSPPGSGAAPGSPPGLPSSPGSGAPSVAPPGLLDSTT